VVFAEQELDLMRRVRRLAGPHIEAIAPVTSVPAAFLAALTANESGAWLIRNTVIPPRFEPAVYRALQAVRDGVREHYGQVTRKMLLGCLDVDLSRYGSSWGLTQIMGWHALRWGADLSKLNRAERHYIFTVRLLVENASDFGLDLTRDFEEMARVWNTGRPADDPRTERIEGKTHDPEYVPNLLRRMEIWRGTNS